MTPEDYLTTVLSSQDLSRQQETQLQGHKKDVTAFLRAEFGEIPVIKYAGSREKGTMIAEKYDLDVVCYFPSTDPRSLKEIRADVTGHLHKRYLVQHKSSAERILNLKSGVEPDGYHVDVVPGRFIQNTKDVFLHVASGEKERIQTNLKLHIDHIANSGCVPVIRLAKLWARRNNVDIKTFVLELFVVRALSGSREKASLARSFRRVMESLKDDFGKVQLVDPANSGNIVSQLVSDSEKAAVGGAATATIRLIGTSDDLDAWKAAFRDSRVTISKTASHVQTRDPGEQFLSDLHISEDLRYRIAIDAKVVQDGFREFLLRASPFPLKKKRKLDFVVTSCNVPQPYSIKWKIKNHGNEAASRGALRGEIVDDLGRSTRRESTLYEGKHYVECYAIKDGVCVAKDHIDVPIGALAD